MLSVGTSIKTSRGDANLIGFVDAIEKNAVPTVGDLLYAGQRQRTRILQRTARGVDVNEVSFKPYSTSGPYYYYPGKNAKNRKGAARNFANKIGLKGRKVGAEVVTHSLGGTTARRSSSSAQRTKLGVKFSSYAAFKASLGRIAVDLRGPSAPHMLQALIVRVKDFILPGTDAAAGGFMPIESGKLEPANEIVLGIYGEEAARASGHNEGYKRLPRRHFLGASESDKVAVLNDILTRIVARVRGALGGSR
jgi:hypothetical protein